MRLKMILLPLLLGSTVSFAQSGPTISGVLTFINDQGTFLLDMGSSMAGQSLGGKLSGINMGTGAAAFIVAFIPKGARVQFKVVKPGGYPEGILYFNGKDLNDYLVKHGMATRKP